MGLRFGEVCLKRRSAELCRKAELDRLRARVSEAGSLRVCTDGLAVEGDALAGILRDEWSWRKVFKVQHRVLRKAARGNEKKKS
jgi:hypothetical protein